jgi:hypothetical protein
LFGHAVVLRKQQLNQAKRRSAVTIVKAWSTLGVRLAESRDSLENLAVTLVRATVQEIDLCLQNPSPIDDTEDFLAWVKSRRQKAKPGKTQKAIRKIRVAVQSTEQFFVSLPNIGSTRQGVRVDSRR